MSQSGYNIGDLIKEARSRWLKPAEVLFILQNYEEDQLTHELAKTPPASGSLFLYNKRVLRFFRKDGHSWRKKKDGKTAAEAHEKLKAGNNEALNCYYAHGEQNPNFQRRSYWMLDEACDHIVLVHYRDVVEGGQNSGSCSQFSSRTTVTLGQGSRSYQYAGFSDTISRLYESNHSLFSPQSVEITSDVEMKGNMLEQSLGVRKIPPISNSSDLKVNEALQKLKQQLSLDDEILEEIDPLYYDCQDSLDLDDAWKDHIESSISINNANDFLMLQNLGNSGQHHHHDSAPELSPYYKAPICSNEMLDFSKSSVDFNSQENNMTTSFDNENELLPTQSQLEKEADCWIDFEGSTSYNNNDFTNGDIRTTLQHAVSSFDNNLFPPNSTFLSHGVQTFDLPTYNSTETMVDYNETFNLGQNKIHLEADQFSISHKQKFTIKEVSPEWGYASETTKVIIVGSFHCDPSKYTWTCKFGDTEVPVQVIQAGVISCFAPPLSPGKVTLSITSGNQESCSEVKAFEYRTKEDASYKSPDELSLLVRLAQMLLTEGDRDNGEDSWAHVIGAVLDESWTSSTTIAWLLQELLKNKLQQRLYSQSGGCKQLDSLISKKDQGILHLVAALDFEWALNMILGCGVNIDFRDINGWTALHWAARFGREKMVAALIAKGASACAVTDPNNQDPIGKTPAKIASSNGHKGLGGYLSEIALTTHLSSLTLEEDDDSKSSAKVEADIRLRSFPSIDHHSSAAIWNASQAAARIQAAFRAHSFRKKRLKEAAAATAASNTIDEYGICSDDIKGLAAASKLTFGKSKKYHKAALSIQKNYRRWKSHTNYQDFRKKVVKIQAHVRGHQVRLQYKVICWAVGILEKIVLRWRRKGAGLRGYKPVLAYIDNAEEEEDILKVFQKKKVDGAVKDAFKRVLSMVEHPDARQQYCRMLVKYREAKEKLQAETNMTIEDDYTYQYNV